MVNYKVFCIFFRIFRIFRLSWEIFELGHAPAPPTPTHLQAPAQNISPWVHEPMGPWAHVPTDLMFPKGFNRFPKGFNR